MVNKSMKKLFVGFAFLSAASVQAVAPSQSKNLFQPRAFSANIAREMLMEGNKHEDSNGCYGEFAAAVAYQRQWSQGVKNTAEEKLDSSVNGLGVFPFWAADETNTMIVGTNVSTGTDLDAYQFGMGAVTLVTDSTITLNPIVRQAGMDLFLQVGASANESGFFAKAKAPISSYSINPQLTVVNPSTVDPANDAYPSGALGGVVTSPNGSATISNAGATPPAPSLTMVQAFAGNTANGLIANSNVPNKDSKETLNPNGGQLAGGDFTPMQFGKINGIQSTGSRFGDMELTAGYMYVSAEDNSFSVAVRGAAATGNKATGEYMLEPIVGRGGNFGLGGYAAGHVKIWEGNNDNHFLFRFMGEAQHLFETETMRSYDLTDNGNGSKYLLVANYARDIYQNSIQNLINVSTLASSSAFGVEGDVAVAFTYVTRGWAFDLGYEFFGRSAETLNVTGVLSNDYAILGRQGVTDSADTYTPTALCQPTATISSSLARADAAAGLILAADDAANRIAGVDSLNVAGAQQAAYLTSKVFTKVTYECIENDYRPHIGVMGEFEISNCNNNALPQWSLALVGGAYF